MINELTYDYFQSWEWPDRKGFNLLSFEDAQSRFNKDETIFLVCYDDKKTIAVIQMSCTYYYLSYLNERLDAYIVYEYQILENLDKEKLCLVGAITRAYDNNDFKLTLGREYFFTLAKSKNENKCDFEWSTLATVEYSESNFITNEIGKQCVGKPLNSDILWESIPEFGHWDAFIKFTENRYKVNEELL